MAAISLRGQRPPQQSCPLLFGSLPFITCVTPFSLACCGPRDVDYCRRLKILICLDFWANFTVPKTVMQKCITVMFRHALLEDTLQVVNIYGELNMCTNLMVSALENCFTCRCRRLFL